MSALDKQVGGDHYKNQGIQPVEYIHANKLNFFEGNAVKYITRHRTKGGKADLEKAIHYIELIMELEYDSRHGHDNERAGVGDGEHKQEPDQASQGADRASTGIDKGGTVWAKSF